MEFYVLFLNYVFKIIAGIKILQNLFRFPDGSRAGEIKTIFNFAMWTGEIQV